VDDADSLLESLRPASVVLADRGFDWRHLIDLVNPRGGQTHIPTQRDRNVHRSIKGYLRKLISNERVARYLAQSQPELLTEFQKIADMTSTLPSEAA
jgi:hypothetical protein